MKYSMGLRLLVAVVVIFFSVKLSNAQNLEQASLLTIDSEILTQSDQDLMASWLGNELGEHQAELVFSLYNINNALNANDTRDLFHTLCDGRSNTIVVCRSPEGNRFGGYNSGEWSSVEQSVFSLNANFLFSIDEQEKYMAIPGERHIRNSIVSLPHFGTNDLRWSNSYDLVNNRQGNGYECPNNESICLAPLNNGIVIDTPESDFTVSLYGGDIEIWQLKDSGPSSRPFGEVGIDANEDGIIDYYGNCYASDNDMFPGSGIFDSESDDLISSWIPEEFNYEAELFFTADLDEPGGSIEEWFFYSKLVEHTVIVMETTEGLKFGGYNSGYWDDNLGSQTGLLDNFIFSITGGTRHNAIPGEVHIITEDQGPIFGGGDIEFVGSIIGDVTLSYLGTDYECGIGNNTENECISYLGGDEEFVLQRFELWKLKDVGTSVISVLDENNNGICDHLEVGSCPGDFDGDGFINVADLGGFLSAFGSACN